MKVIKKTLLGVGAVSALAIAFAASEFDWHLDFMRENPGLFLKAILYAFVIYGSSAFIGGVLLSIAMCNSWVKRVFNEWLLFVVFFAVGLCLVLVFDWNIRIGVFHVFNKAEVTTMKYRKAAEQGDADAQYRLGTCYANGDGVEMNKAEAVRWYRKAAEQGNVDAQCRLGSYYTSGIGVEKNEAEAAKWYRMAAEQGNVDAQYFTGRNYKLGIGVVQDKDEAEKWFGKIKHPFDQYRIGNMLFVVAQLDLAQNKTDIIYAKQDKPEVKAEAVKWYRKAAEQGYADAQYELGICYRDGYGVAQDKIEGVKWLKKAAKNGVKKAQDALDEILKQKGLK